MNKAVLPALVLAALAASGRAFAVPPIPPMDEGAFQAYVAATKENNLRAYADLFAPDAEITVEGGRTYTKASWVDAATADFVPERKINYLSAIADYVYEDSKRGAVVLMTVEEQQCHPQRLECFAQYRTETLKALAGKIVSLHRSADFSFGLTSNGLWKSFMEEGW